MAGKFEITKDKAGKFRFRLKAANGEIIATSEAYESRPAPRTASSPCKRTHPARRWSTCLTRPRRSRRGPDQGAGPTDLPHHLGSRFSD
jgi:uncharacterized protein